MELKVAIILSLAAAKFNPIPTIQSEKEAIDGKAFNRNVNGIMFTT